jgi:hypothetical protein
MGGNSETLSARTYQPGHDQSFRKSEKDFIKALNMLFPEPEWLITDHPRELTRTINDRYGIVPEASLRNLRTGKVMYFEVKKQGPIGNADERACKHHTVAFYQWINDITGMPYHPFVTVFTDALAILPRYTLKHPYYFEKGNYVNWQGYDLRGLAEFMRENVVPLLEEPKC